MEEDLREPVRVPQHQISSSKLLISEGEFDINLGVLGTSEKVESTEKLHNFSKANAMRPFKKAKRMRALQNLPKKIKFDLSDSNVHQLNLYYG